MEETTRKSADLWSGLALAALGAYIIVQAARWEYMGAEGPGPGFFPMWYGIAMVALSAMLVILNLRSRYSPVAAAAFPWRRVGRALLVWLAFAVSVALFKPLGFVLSFALLVFFVVAVMYRRRLVVAAAVAVASAAGFYLVFPLALGVALPAGPWGF
jgi:putative tricarboxylic transport membrane protein